MEFQAQMGASRLHRGPGILSGGKWEGMEDSPILVTSDDLPSGGGGPAMSHRLARMGRKQVAD